VVMVPTLLVILSLLSPQDCPMQNPFRDGSSLQQHLVAGGSLDPGYTGLHDVVAGGWAGVDTQGNSSPAGATSRNGTARIPGLISSLST